MKKISNFLRSIVPLPASEFLNWIIKRMQQMFFTVLQCGVRNHHTIQILKLVSHCDPQIKQIHWLLPPELLIIIIRLLSFEYYNYSLCVSPNCLVTLDTVKSYVDQLTVKLLEVCLSLNNFHLKMMHLKALECTFLNFLRHEKIYLEV